MFYVTKQKGKALCPDREKCQKIIQEVCMKKTLICLSIILVVLFFTIGCAGPKYEETITDFFNGINDSNEELFLSSLDSESIQIWKELNYPISALSGEAFIWKLEKIKKEDSNNVTALIKIFDDEEKESLELSLIKEKSNWKIKGKDILLELTYSITSACAGNLRSLGLIIECYSVDHKRHYPQNLEILAKLGYIKSQPKCPLCEEYYIYKVDNWSSTKFEVFCPCAGKHQKNEKRVQKVKVLKYASRSGVILQ